MMTVARPWLLAVALALAGVSGAYAVYVAGSRISASDRAAILAWEQEAARVAVPAIERLGLIVGSPRRALTEADDRFSDAVVRLQRFGEHEVLGRAHDAMTHALLQGASALQALLNREEGPFLYAREAAFQRYREAREAIVRLRCLSRVEACEESLLPAL